MMDLNLACRLAHNLAQTFTGGSDIYSIIEAEGDGSLSPLYSATVISNMQDAGDDPYIVFKVVQDGPDTYGVQTTSGLFYTTPTEYQQRKEPTMKLVITYGIGTNMAGRYSVVEGRDYDDCRAKAFAGTDGGKFAFSYTEEDGMRLAAVWGWKEAPLTPMYGFKFLGDVTIQHNHGIYVLRDAVWHPYPYGKEHYNTSGSNGYIEGYIVRGGVTNRLFHATHTTPAKVDSLHRQDYCPITRLYKRSEGGWDISCISCG
jgi:hypothetical protein